MAPFITKITLQRLLIIIYTFITDSTRVFPFFRGWGIECLLRTNCHSNALNVVFQGYDFLVIFGAFLHHLCCGVCWYIFCFSFILFVGHQLQMMPKTKEGAKWGYKPGYKDV